MDLLNATIEVMEMSDKKGQYGFIKKIKGKNIETGQANTYTVYDKKKDGTTSTAWSQLSEINVGDTVQVGYAEQKGTMQDGTPYTSRIVRNFNKDIGNGVRQYQTSQAVKSPRTGQSGASGKVSEAKWDEIAVGKCQTAFLAAFIQSGHSIQDAKLQAVAARRLAEVVVYGHTETPKEQEELPTIYTDDPTNGELNPMVNDEPPIEAYDDEMEG